MQEKKIQESDIKFLQIEATLNDYRWKNDTKWIGHIRQYQYPRSDLMGVLLSLSQHLPFCIFLRYMKEGDLYIDSVLTQGECIVLLRRQLTLQYRNRHIQERPWWNSRLKTQFEFREEQFQHWNLREALHK